MSSLEAHPKLSIIIGTRNRSYAIIGCLEAIVASLKHADFNNAEILVVDNNSTDETGDIIRDWVSTCPYPASALTETRGGLARAQNKAIRLAKGDLFVFTDDDCRMQPEYIENLLRYDAADNELTIRGGRIELGDPTDLPLTINVNNERNCWSRKKNNARYEAMNGVLNGCNMTMRRDVFERIGLFDEEFGPGARTRSGADTELFYRAYAAGITIEYVPDMAVSHFHGRKSAAAGHKLWKNYMFGMGAICTRYLFIHPNLVRPFYWDIKNAVQEIITGTNNFLPSCEFSHVDKVKCMISGAIHYLLSRSDSTAYRPSKAQLARLRSAPVHDVSERDLRVRQTS